MRYFLILLICFLVAGCSLFNSNEKSKSIQDFTWTSDTLWNEDAFQVLMDQIWGSGPDDLYVVGHAADNDHTIYHYDGNTWEVPSYNDRHGGTLTGAFNFDDVWGNSERDVWAVGKGTSIAHRHEHYRATHYYHGFLEEIPKEGDLSDERGFASVWCRSTNDVWFTDYRGRVYHYDGSVIKRDTSKMELDYDEKDVFASYIAGDGDGNIYYNIKIIEPLNTTIATLYVLKKSDGKWVEIFRGSNNTGNYVSIFHPIENGELYSCGSSLMKLVGDTFETVYKNYSINDVSGTSLEDLLVALGGGTAYHYNGTEWQEIEELNQPDIIYRFCWYNGKEAFVGGGYYNKTVIFHGK